jgi:hypothetical protein
MSDKAIPRRSKAQQWATRDLFRGDLTMLASVKSHQGEPDHHQIDRLVDRGFIKPRWFGGVRITWKGRLALLLVRPNRPLILWIIAILPPWLVLAVILFGRIRLDFIERVVGAAPDNGDGSLEAAMLGALVVVITWIASTFLRRRASG